MSAFKIVRIPILPWGLLNAHLLLDSRGCVLVDAGLPGSDRKIERVLRRHGLSFGDIKLIIITHAHVDHAGGAARLRERSGAPILAHEDDAPHYRREAPMTFCPSGWFGRLFLKTGLMAEPYAAFEPDILLCGDESMELTRYGVHGAVRHTPGHTAGSISVELSSNDAMVGDLVSSGILLGGIVRTGHAKRPPFEDDPRAVGLVLQHMIRAGVERFHMGHGGPLDAREVARHARELLALAKRTRVVSGSATARHPP